MQDTKSSRKNRQFFAENNEYKSAMSGLALYELMARSVRREVAGAQRLLDVGNGGVFIYPIDSIPEVTAIDIFVEESFALRYPRVRWRELSALDLDYEESFDTVVEVNTLHHVNGRSVRECYQNLEKIMTGVYRALQEGGKFVVMESTVPGWFLATYKTVYPFLTAIWPLTHPPTFQFHYQDIWKCAEKAGFSLVELAFVPKVSDLLTLGFRVRPWMSPIQVAKFVFVK